MTALTPDAIAAIRATLVEHPFYDLGLVSNAQALALCDAAEELVTCKAHYDTEIEAHKATEATAERYRAALVEVVYWGVSVPLGMTEDEYNAGTLRDIKRHARAALAEPQYDC